VIYSDAKNVANNLIASDGSIAIRICKANFGAKLMNALGRPLVSTSANVSGLPTPLCFNDISLDIIEGVDYVVKSEQEDTVLKQPSAIVRWEKDQLIVIRP
jgi:L-threonylcarbamoyladenylate synthase